VSECSHGKALCDHCGSSDWEIEEQEMHLQVFRCKSCGHSVTSRFVGPEEVGDHVDVAVWALLGEGEIINKQLLAVKRLWAPDQSIAQIKERLADNGGRFNLGRHSSYHASQIRQLAVDNGIEVSFEICR
jgi:hypothetical protein